MPGTSHALRWGIRALVLAAALAGLVEALDAAGGGVLARHHAEYAGGGSMKWRGPDGKLFQTVLLAAGIWVYPLAAAGAVAFAVTALRERSRGLRLACAGGLLCCLAVLARFVQQGVLGAALGVRW